MAHTKPTPRKSTGGRAPRKTLGRVNGDNVVEDPNIDDDTAQKLKEIEELETMQASLKHITKKWTEQNQAYYAETVDEEIPDQVNWWSKFALCLVKHMDSGNTRVQKTSLQVNSQHLKDILKDTISQFPGVSFQTKDITIDAPYRVLFHYKDELAQAGENLEDEEAIAHLNLLLDFIDEHFKETIEESDNLKEQGLMSYEYLWTIFRPGMTIYAPIFGQPRAFTLTNYAHQCDPAGLQLWIEFVDFDGEDLGDRSTNRLVPAFSGAVAINSLCAYPIQYHADPEALRRQLIDRGRRMESYAGMHFCRYNGIALEQTQFGFERYNVEGRVVVDTKTFHRLNANYAFNLRPFKTEGKKQKIRRRNYDDYNDYDEGNDGDEDLDLVPEERLELDPLTDDQCLLATATVRGFSFSEKRWLDFFVDKLNSPDWNSDCFKQLVLPETQKDLVQALVANHTQKRNGFDDIVKGKGKGLILVLHGPPGVGKTLTAETVAEYCKRPLYMVSSGDLGTDASTLDNKLSRILDMASTWRAVLLIDEADIFLERRSLHDMQRNSLVSIFLRVLEYYEGILFLTSNRVATFDDAFKSRIHVPLKYSSLTMQSRKQVWQNFLGKMMVDDEGVEIDDEGYDSLAQADINGRQIKNVIRTAKSLAQFHGQKLDRQKLEQVIQIQMEFERDLDLEAGGEGVDGLANGR
ncbi:uncharacterized protein RCC_10344 [Ramularia collo-cygni]|uniref:AAA+ ATPase domain-containing protein n=1 Tax=Ramularia collo-cygni TaxID=112498 RepID=A0A2D3VLS0_9PEZI|nr:uncharacterized protein RCC_10344 [Ramularia collo-cygni]CZT24619.1 uncharacterized protein RCC_10344 [Ramularia collo-cygni]